MSLAAIRETIAAALQHEAESHLLQKKYLARLPELLDKLLLPEHAPVEALMAFTTSYIRSAPASLRFVTAVSKRYGFHAYAAPFLDMAEAYFLSPPSDLTSEEGLEALLDEAFLAHRLLEEVNDHHIRELRRPLLPVDMTEANTIVHHLLGDEFASRLEQLVQMKAQQLLDREHVWRRADAFRARAGTAMLSSDSLVRQGMPSVRLRLAS